MRLSAIVKPLAVFVLAGLLSVLAARAAVHVVEDRSAVAVGEALAEDGQDWVRVLPDGLQIILEGEAPTEARRFRAISVAGTMVDASRVIDHMSVTETKGIAPPLFSVEILRNDSGISLIGLIPAAGEREEMAARVARIAGDHPVADFLETADYPMPAGWRRAMAYALDALEQLPRAKISVTAAHVKITAISDSEEQKHRLETELARQVPEGVGLALSISAPRPVISPFTTRFILGRNGTARFEACAADSAEAEARILAAARAAGLKRNATCTIGLGVPSRTWGDAVALSIGALAELGGGSVTASDADITLAALEGTDRALFDRVVGELENALPDLFALAAVLPVPAQEAPQGPPEFTVTLSSERLVQIRGRVADELMNETVENYARARLGNVQIAMGTRIAGELPQDWSVRVLAGIEALAALENGALLVTPDHVSVRGETGRKNASDRISQLLIEKLGQKGDFEIDVTYREDLDPIAALPTPEECLAQIASVTERRKITFDPSSSTISGEAQVVVDEIAEILRRCADLRIEIAGYTDSQGREEMNQRLSQERAEAVLKALRTRRVPVGSFLAVGYGEKDPIADNGTEEGREANRRIEFRLIQPEPVPGEASEEAEDTPEDTPEADAEAAETAEAAEEDEE